MNSFRRVPRKLKKKLKRGVEETSMDFYGQTRKYARNFAKEVFWMAKISGLTVNFQN